MSVLIHLKSFITYRKVTVLASFLVLCFFRAASVYLKQTVRTVLNSLITLNLSLDGEPPVIPTVGTFSKKTINSNTDFFVAVNKRFSAEVN